MANKYYYFVSTLPCIEFGKPIPVTKEAFLEEASKWLTSKDLSLLKQVDIRDLSQKTTDTDFLKQWKQYDVNLRQQLKQARSIRKNSLDEKPSQEAAEILSEQTPLFAERAFEKRRYDFLENIELDYHFDLNFLVLYFLKLQIVKRLESFSKEEAETVFKECCEVDYV